MARKYDSRCDSRRLVLRNSGSVLHVNEVAEFSRETKEYSRGVKKIIQGHNGEHSEGRRCISVEKYTARSNNIVPSSANSEDKYFDPTG
jgi:hypothetical protein